MKKILALLLTAILILGLLSACGKAPAPESEAQPDAAVETTEQPAAETEEKSEGSASADAPSAETAEAQTESDKMTVSVVSQTVEAGCESVTVPVKILGNTGLAGAFISVQYDKALTLTEVKAGDALGSLTCTPGGNLSANPYNLLWDGQAADASDGDIALLTFAVPKAAGEYKISLSGDPKSFYDNDLKDVPVFFADGGITVTAKG